MKDFYVLRTLLSLLRKLLSKEESKPIQKQIKSIKVWTLKVPLFSKQLKVIIQPQTIYEKEIGQDLQSKSSKTTKMWK